MPLIIPKDLPAYEELQQENVFVMHQERAMSQHIRPLRILILNLMPTKIVTETQLARLLANSPLQVQVTFLQTATHSTTHTAPEHMKAFYKTFDEIKNERFDGMIITGAPIEDLDYEDVDYWDELCRIMDYTKENVYSTIHPCWGALAGLYYHFGIPKVHLDKKMFGVFEHRVTRPSNPLVRGFDEVFYAPHSRWAGLPAPPVKPPRQPVRRKNAWPPKQPPRSVPSRSPLRRPSTTACSTAISWAASGSKAQTWTATSIGATARASLAAARAAAPRVTASCPARTAQSLSAGIRARTSRTLARRSSVPSFIWRPTGATLPIK